VSGTGFLTDGKQLRTDTDPLRIVLIAPPYFDIPPRGYGGTETVVADLADSLTARGHKVTVLGAGHHARIAAKFVPLWDTTQSERLGQPYPEVMHALKVRRVIEEIAATEGIDLIHDHTFAGPLNAPAYRNLGIPTVATVHGPIDEDLYPYYRELGDEIGLIAISDRQRELAPDLNWVGRVHNSLRIEDWPFAAEKQNYALFLGRYAPYKGAHLAVEAAHAAGIPLILAGKCDEPSEKEYFENEVRPRLGPNDTVFGEADAVAKRELLANARCLLFPITWEEPFGMVMIEAMACGTPVVALRGGAVGEVVRDGVTGIVCDLPMELPPAIEAAAALDPADCRRHVANHFGFEQFGAGYERIYREVVGRRAVPGSHVALRRILPDPQRTAPDPHRKVTA